MTNPTDMGGEDLIREITTETALRFRSFGGGVANPNNPISIALANRRPEFAAGVDIEEVVRFVLDAQAAAEADRRRGR